MVFNKITDLFAKLKDGAGNLITSTDLGNSKRGLDTFSEIIQKSKISTANSTTTNIAGGGLFTGTAELTAGYAGAHVLLKSDNNLELTAQQSNDGVYWDAEDKLYIEHDQGESYSVQLDSIYFRILVRNLDKTATTYLRVNTTLLPFLNPLPRTLTSKGHLKVSVEEHLPTIEDFAGEKVSTSNNENESILYGILDELKKLNLYMAIITDEKIGPGDVEE